MHALYRLHVIDGLHDHHKGVRQSGNLCVSLVKPPRQVFDSFVGIFRITLAAALALEFVDQTVDVGFKGGNTNDRSLLKLGELGNRKVDRLRNFDIRDLGSLVGGDLRWVPA